MWTIKPNNGVYELHHNGKYIAWYGSRVDAEQDCFKLNKNWRKV